MWSKLHIRTGLFKLLRWIYLQAKDKVMDLNLRLKLVRIKELLRQDDLQGVNKGILPTND